MGCGVNSKLFEGQAYKLFLGELEESIAVLRGIASANEYPSSDRLTQLRVRFHNLRGSAGFFGFVQVSELAHNIEGFFFSGDMHRWNSELFKHISKLEAQWAELPLPVNSSSPDKSD